MLLQYVFLPGQDWDNAGIDYLSLPTVDYSSPSTEDIEKGIEFMQKYADQDETVYVHCKAGRTRSVTLVGCYLIQVQISSFLVENETCPRRKRIIITVLHLL